MGLPFPFPFLLLLIGKLHFAQIFFARLEKMQQQEPPGGARRKLSTMRVCVVVAFFCAVGYGVYWNVNYVLYSIRTEFARDQIKTFSSMERIARSGSERDAAEALQYVIEYYPSGTKQTTDSTLDRIVEHARSRAIDEIVSILRSRTRRDFGNDAKQWIQYLHTMPRFRA
jgi:hypothetical protein